MFRITMNCCTIVQMFETMNGKPMTVRLIDPPLHEFLPDLTKLSVKMALDRERGTLDPADEELLAVVRKNHEANPIEPENLRDLQAAALVGASPYLVRTGNGERTLAAGDLPPGTKIFDDLANMVDRLLHANQAAPDTVDMARTALAKKKQH